MVTGRFRIAILTLMVMRSCTAFAEDAPSAAPGNQEALEKQVEELRGLVAQLSKRVEVSKGGPQTREQAQKSAQRTRPCLPELQCNQ